MVRQRLPAGDNKKRRKKQQRPKATDKQSQTTTAPVGRSKKVRRKSAAPVTKAAANGGDLDEREALVNDCRRGTKYEITPKVVEVTAIHAFMVDIDCKILDAKVFGEESVESAEALYDNHISIWLERDPVLAKAEVRDTGGGLHVLLGLDTPIIVSGDAATLWDDVAKGIRNALPGDPNLNGIIALTRPVGALNTKYDPPREVRQLRPGQAVTQAEILDLNRRLSENPALLWMRLFFGGEQVTPCPFCGKESLGLAGSWQCRCYGCGRVRADSLIYRLYSSDFLDPMTREHCNG